MDNTILCSLKIKRSCGCYEAVMYSGKRDDSINKYVAKQESIMCVDCMEAEIRKIRGV